MLPKNQFKNREAKRISFQDEQQEDASEGGESTGSNTNDFIPPSHWQQFNNSPQPALIRTHSQTVLQEKKAEEQGLRYWAAQYFGKFCAVAYGALCGLGTASAVNALFESPGMGFAGSEFVAYAFGSVTFVVNVALFLFVVPEMLVKLFSPKHSMYDETFEATVTKKNKITKKNERQKIYIKIKRNENSDKVVSVQRFSLRWWLITLFSFAFAAAQALVYSGLLMSKLADTTGWMGIGASGPGFLAVAIPFFIISVICNWAFNKYDASEQISRHDFFEKLMDGILKLFLFRRDDSLMLESEIGNRPDSVLGRQVLRLAIMGGISYLGFFALYSVAHMGTASLFGFMGIAIIPAVKWTLFSLSIVAASYYYANSTFRFSTIAAQQLTRLAQAYRSIGLEDSDIKMPKPLYHLTQCTLVIPALILLGAGLWNLAKIQWSHAKNAYSREDAPLSPNASLFTRATYDVTNSWEALRWEPNDDIGLWAWNYLARPQLALAVGVGHFVINNINNARAWIMHALAFINAAGNGAFSNPALQIPEDELFSSPDERPAQTENPLSSDALKATAGGFQGSFQCYANSVVQNEQDKGATYSLKMLRFMKPSEKNEVEVEMDPLVYLDTDVQADLRNRKIIGPITREF